MKANSECLKGKTEEMESKAMSSVLELVEKSGALKLEDVLQHRVTRECLSIFNANGTIRKVQKSKLLDKFNMSSIPEPSLYTAIVDMGFIWHLAAPNIEEREKCYGTMYTWKDYADKVVESVLKRHKYAERIICLNDPYDLSYTIKDSKHNLRQK